MACLAFAAEVGGDFAPLVGGPFEDGVADRAVGCQPSVGAREEFECLGGLGRGCQGGFGVSLAKPCEGIARVGVDGCGEVAGHGKEGGEVYHGKVFGDVVCAGQECFVADVENLGAVDHSHGAIFHFARIARACAVYGDCVEPYAGDGCVVAHAALGGNDRWLGAEVGFAFEQRSHEAKLFAGVAAVGSRGLVDIVV